MENQNLKITKHEPLTFACIRSDEQFMASGKSLQRVADEVADHIRQQHPELAYSELLKRTASEV